MHQGRPHSLSEPKHGRGSPVGRTGDPALSRESIRVARPMRFDMHLREGPDSRQAATACCCFSFADATAILRGFARSAIGITTLSTPLS